MLDQFYLVPGRLFLAAVLLPLVPAVLMLFAGMLRNLARPQVNSSSLARAVFGLLGGDAPSKLGGYVTLAALVAAALCASSGLMRYMEDSEKMASLSGAEAASMESRWSERIDWISIGGNVHEKPATALKLGYRIDRLTAIMMTMVTIVSSLIVLFSIGYMGDEAKTRCVDHEVHVRHGPAAADHDNHGHDSQAHAAHDHGGGHGFERRGRFGRFFTYLSLFAFSMLNLLIADNLFQVFVGWELVGVCSFLLIGFYCERPSASTAANKAFIMNRIGDAGFLIGIGIAWSVFGTLNIKEIIDTLAVRRPDALTDSLWFIMGVGLFLGCVGKSAQFPLHTWLPDAMEGPTPVSALIHAATMVAAGVYLVGRCYPMFSPDALMVIAYTGCITLFLAATIAAVQTDIKRVLAYSTVSQLGYMMLALGIGGWTAGLLHLLTHAFFKALLFLCSGSVIFGLHHVQDLRKMGGLAGKMPMTSRTMLIGVLAIAGAPFFSGWYSKDMILSSSLGFSIAHPEHWLLFFVPLGTAALTAYYMFRLWFLAFAGTPRDKHVYDHAHESPTIMTAPLVVLAVFSVIVAWGWPLWNAEASRLGRFIHEGQPAAHELLFEHARHKAEENELVAGVLALVAAVGGAFVAHRIFGGKAAIVQAEMVPPELGARGFLTHKWYFDEIYDAVFRKPTVIAAFCLAAVDKRPNAALAEDDRMDSATLDGVINMAGQLTARLGEALRPLQSGLIRRYVLVLTLTVAGLLGMLAVLKAK